MLTNAVVLAAEEPSRGWGGPIALVAAVAAFIAFATIHDHFWGTSDDGEDPSPTPGDAPGVSDPAQVSEVSDTDDTSRDTDGDAGGWWAPIREIAGRRVRAAVPAVPVDDEVDVPLDEDQDDVETIEDAIVRLTDEGVAYAEIVRRVMRDYEVSESTAKRRIREVRSRVS